MMLRTKEGRIIWCEREYIDHIETKLDTNEYIFSVNEQQKVYSMRKRGSMCKDKISEMDSGLS